MAASTNTDKLKKVYDLYTSNGLIKTTDFDTFSKASEDQKKKLYDLGVKQGLFKSTDYGTFSTAWVKKKEQGVQPQQPTGDVSERGLPPTPPISGSKPSPKYNWKAYNKRTQPEQGFLKSVKLLATGAAARLGVTGLLEDDGILNQDDINGLAEEAAKRAQTMKSFDKSFYNPDGKTVNKSFSKSYLNGTVLPNIGYAENGYSLNSTDQDKVQQRFDQILSNMKAMTPAQAETVTKNLNKAMYNAKIEDQKKMEIAEKKRNNASKQEIDATEKFYDNTKVEGAGKMTPQEERLRQDLRMQGIPESEIKAQLEKERQKVDFKYGDWFDKDVLDMLSEQDKKDIQQYVSNNPEIKTKYTYYATRSTESQAELITQAIMPRLNQALNGLKIYSDNQMIEKLGQLGELNKVLGVYDFELNLLKKQIENYAPKELTAEQKAQLDIDKNQFQIKDNEYTEAMKGFNALKQQLTPVYEELGKLKQMADSGDQMAAEKYNSIYNANRQNIDMYNSMIPELKELENARNMSAQSLNKYATSQQDIASYAQYKQSVDKYNQIYDEVLPLYQKQQELVEQLPKEDVEKIFQLYQDMNSAVSLSNELEKTKEPTVGKLITTSMQNNPLFSFHMATTFPFIKSAGEFTLKGAAGIMRSTSDILETLSMKPDDYYSGADFAADMIVKGSDLTGDSWIRDVMPGYQMKDFYDVNGNFVYSPLSLTVGAFEQLGVVASAALGTSMMGGASSNTAIIAPMFFATYDDNKELANQLGYSDRFESMTAGVLFSAIESVSELILPDIKFFQGDAKKQLFMTFLDNFQKGGKAVAIKSITEAVGKEYGEELMVEFGKVIATAMTNAIGGNVQQYTVSGADLFQTFVFTALASGPLQTIKAVGTSTSSFNNAMKFEMAKDLKSSVDMIESYRRIGKINDVKAEQLKRELNVISAVQGQLPDDLSQAKRVVVSGLYAERSGLEQKMNDPNVTNEVKEGYKSAINKINSRISQVIVADDTEFNDAYNKELETQTKEVVSEIKKQYPELSAPTRVPAAPVTETDRIRTQILDDIFKDSTAQNKADALEQRMNNAEEISMTEINDVLDGLYKQVEMVMDNYFDNEAGQQYAQALLDKIDKIKSYEFATDTETAVVTERKAVQTARASLQETASVINLARAPRATATITSEDGTTGTYSIEVGPDGAVTFEQPNTEPIRIGNVNDVNKTASIVETVLNEQGLPQSVSFSITDENGRKHTITVEADKKLKPQQLLDLAINIRANELGTVDPTDFDTAYQEVTKEVTTVKPAAGKEGVTAKPQERAVQVKTAGQVPVQPEAGVGEKVAEGKPQAEPEAPAKEGVKEEVAAPKKQTKADKLNELQNQLIRAKINSRIPNILKALQSVGVKIEIIEDPAEYDRIMRDEYGNNYISAGVYVAESGKIYLNPERMIATGEGVKILYHEATHPILNIIRNTNKPLYDKMVRAMEQAEKASTGKNREAFSKLKKFGEAYEGIGYDESQVNDEKLTELLALIANGDIDMAQMPKSFTDTVIDFLNQIAKFLGIKARLSPTSDIGALRQVAKDIKNSFDKGVDIGEFLGYDNKGNIDAKDLFVNEDGTPFNQMSLSNKFVDLMNGVVFEYIEDTEDFNRLKREGVITDDKKLSDYEGYFAVLHIPDNAFTGKAFKDNELILDGKGGVYFPIRFNDKGYFWASTSNAAKSLANILNESRMMNPDGKIRMALISTEPKKILSSSNASTGVMEILFSKAFDKRAKLKESNVVDSYVEGVKLANIEFISMFEKKIKEKIANIKKAKSDASRMKMQKNLSDFKKKGPTKAPKLTKSMSADDIKAILNEFFSPDNSSFREREAFNTIVLDLIAQKVNNIDKVASERSGKELRIVATEVLSFLGMTKNAVRLKSTGGRLSAANLVQGFSDFMMEPMLKGEDKNKVYAILEVDSEVEAVSIGKEHGSYDYAVKPIDKKAKITLNILQDRLDWKDNVIDPETNQPMDPERASNVLPTYGVSPKPVKLSVSQMSLYTATIDGVDVELKGIDVDVVNGFYSPLEQEVFGSKQDKMPAKKWLDRFKGREEAKWTGLNDWLESQEGVVSKQDILDYMKENRIVISEVVLETKDTAKERFGFSQELELPGEKENYREVLVTLPNKGVRPIGKWEFYEREGYTKEEFEQAPKEFQQKLFDKWKAETSLVVVNKKEQFKSSHFDEPNILVHLRMNERTDAEGNKVLFIEEVQSDWAQEGRRKGFAQKEQKPKKLEKLSREQLIEMLAWNDPNGIYTDEDSRREGYEPMTKEEALDKVNELIQTEGDAFETERFLRQGSMVEGIPTAPFVMNTSDWVKLAMRVALKEAVKSGANSIAWTTGEQQNDRFDLSKSVDQIVVIKVTDNSFNVVGRKGGERLIERTGIDRKELEATVGKDITEKAINGQEIFEGQDLKVGGKGMIGFYGTVTKPGIVGQVTSKLFGQEVGTVEVNGVEQPSVTVTPQMKAEVRRGLPQMSLMNQADVAKRLEEVKELFKSNPELASIGTPEQYSQYLDTIFPESKVKDIVYHGYQKGVTNIPNDRKNIGKYFSESKDAAMWFGSTKFIPENKQNEEEPWLWEESNNDAIIETSIINLTNPAKEKNIFNQKNDYPNNDGVITKEGDYDTYIVFEPEQIHILGSKQDVERFKKWKKEQPLKEKDAIGEPTTTVSKAQVADDLKGKMKKAFPSGQMSIFAPRGMMNTAEVANKQYPLHQALVQLGIDAYQNQGIRNYASFVTYAKQFDDRLNKNPYMERVWEDVTRIVNGKKPLIQSEKDYRDFLVKQNNVPVANAERAKKRNRANMVTKAKEALLDSRAEFFKALSQSSNKLWSIAANYVNVIGGMGAKAIYTANTLADGVFKGLKTKKEYLIGDQMQSESDIFNNMLLRIRVLEIQRKMQDKFNEFMDLDQAYKAETDPAVKATLLEQRDNVKRYLDRNNMLIKDAAGNYSLGTYMFANNLNERTAFNELLQLQTTYPDLYDKLMQRADAYHMAFNTLLDMQLEAGLISQESYDEMVEYKYVPMRYIGYMIEEIVAGDDIKINSEQSKLIKRLKGGSEENIDMAFDEALKFQAYMVTRAIAKNNAMQKVYEAAKSENFQGPFYEPDVTGVDADGNFEYGNIPAEDAIIYFYMDGKKMALATSKEIASALNGSNMFDLGMSDEALGWAMMTIPFRAVTTNLNPGFGLAQLILDIPQALLTNEAYSNVTTGLPRILFRDLKLLTGKGLGELSKLLGIDMGFDKEWNELAMEAREYGGLITFTGMDNETMGITQAAEKAMDKKSNMLTNALAAYRDKVEKFGTTMETVTRLAVYRKMRNNLISEYKKANNGNAPTGEDLDNIRTQAAATSLNVLNYNRGGTLIKPLNRALAYLNVAFQVPYSVAKYAKKNPYQFSMKAMEVAAWPVVITMLGYLAMDDDDREKFLEIYNNYNEYEKANYWHILNPLWDGKDPEDMIIRIKKPTILLPLVNSTEVGVMHSITGGKTVDPKDYVKKQLPSDMNAMQPIGWQLLSSAPSINALMKYFGNYDVYRKTEIVKNEKDIFDFDEGQLDPNVGKFYKYVAKKTGYFDENTKEYFESISPARMDAAVKSTLGNYETNITTALPLLVTDYALSRMSSDYANFKDPAQTDDVKSFMEKVWEGVGLKKRFFAKVPEVNPKIYENMTDEKKIKNYYREEIRSRMDEIMNGNLSREQKREEIRNYYDNQKKTNSYYDAKDLNRDIENAYKYVDNKNWLKDKPKWYRTLIFAPDTESKIMIFDVSTENMDREDKRLALKDLYVKGFVKEGDEAWIKYIQKEFPKQGK